MFSGVKVLINQGFNQITLGNVCCIFIAFMLCIFLPPTYAQKQRKLYCTSCCWWHAVDPGDGHAWLLSLVLRTEYTWIWQWPNTLHHTFAKWAIPQRHIISMSVESDGFCPRVIFKRQKEIAGNKTPAASFEKQCNDRHLETLQEPLKQETTLHIQGRSKFVHWFS